MKNKINTYKTIMLIALALGAILITMPAMQVEFMGQEMKLSLMEIGELRIIPMISWGTSALAALYLLVHINQSANGMAGENICFFGCIAAGIEILSVVLLFVCKEEILRNAGLNAVMDWLNIKFALTWSQYLLVLSSTTIIVCSVLLMKKTKSNCCLGSENNQDQSCKKCIRCGKK